MRIQSVTMKTDIWMPWYPGDYQRDTQHLSTLEHGAYRLLIDACWCRGGSLPSDDADLARITHLSTSEWATMRTRIAKFFQTENGEWTHKRVTIELNRAKSNSESQAKRTEAARRALQTKRMSVTTSVTENVTKSPSPSPSPSPSQSSAPTPSAPVRVRFAPPVLEIVKLNGAKIGLPELECVKFHSYYESNGWKVGRNPMKCWRAAMVHWRGNYQERKNGTSNRNFGRSDQANPRNVGVCPGTTDYAAAAKKYQQVPMAKEVAQDQSSHAAASAP